MLENWNLNGCSVVVIKLKLLFKYSIFQGGNNNCFNICQCILNAERKQPLCCFRSVPKTGYC